MTRHMFRIAAAAALTLAICGPAQAQSPRAVIFENREAVLEALDSGMRDGDLTALFEKMVDGDIPRAQLHAVEMQFALLLGSAPITDHGRVGARDLENGFHSEVWAWWNETGTVYAYIAYQETETGTRVLTIRVMDTLDTALERL